MILLYFFLVKDELLHLADTKVSVKGMYWVGDGSKRFEPAPVGVLVKLWL